MFWQGVIDYFKSFTTDTMYVVFCPLMMGLAVSIAFYSFSENKKHKFLYFIRDTLIFLILKWSLTSIAKGFYYCFPNYFFLFFFDMLSNILIIFGFSEVFIKQKWLKKLPVTLTLAVLVCLTTAMDHTIYGCLDRYNATWLIYVFRPLVFISLFLICLFLFRHKFSNFNDVGKPMSLLLLSDFIELGLGFSIEMGDLLGGMISVYSIALIFLLITLCVFIYIMSYSITKEREDKLLLETEKRYYKVASEQMKLTKSNLDLLRKIRHDMANSYNYMSLLLKDGQLEKLGSALESFSPSSIRPEYYIDCGNEDISAILTFEGSKAIAKGQTLKTKIMVPPSLPFHGKDLCSLLSNMIDNAIEANNRNNKKEIRLIIMIQGGFLDICVINPVLPETKLNLKTTKHNPENHGYGLRIISEIAEKYDGEALFEIEDGNFVAEVLLSLGSKEN